MNNAVRTTHDTDKQNSVGLLTDGSVGRIRNNAASHATTIRKKDPRPDRAGKQKMQRQGTDTYDDLMTLSRFDNRKILPGEHMHKLTTDSLIRSAHV